MERHDFNINGAEFTIFNDDRAWGDGTHESTKFVMELITKYGVDGKSVIDIGTGTGILSVLCAKLGAIDILALDNDSHSIEFARKNFKRNTVDVELEISDLVYHIPETADVVIANLPGHVQVENVKIVAKNLNPDGLFIMSWYNQLPFDDYVRGFEVLEHVKGVEYDAYVLRKGEW